MKMKVPQNRGMLVIYIRHPHTYSQSENLFLKGLINE
jgi:hypothetical protein